MYKAWLVMEPYEVVDLVDWHGIECHQGSLVMARNHREVLMGFEMEEQVEDHMVYRHGV